MFYFLINMISPISTNFNINKKYNIKNNVSFGTISRDVKDKYNKLLYRNDTRLFREDLNWWLLFRHILQKQQPQKIYCYACSDGSEPYSIAIGLINKLGYQKAQSYFPIIAKDVDEQVIKKAKSGKIELDETDVNRVKKYTKTIPFAEDKSFLKKISNAENRPNTKTYIADKELAKCIDFRVGDIIEDSKNIDLSNSIIFFRNVWPYLGEEKENNLLKNLSENFTDTTTLVVGGFDAASCDEEWYFDEKMWKHKLWEVKPKIYEKFISDPSITKTCIKAISNTFYNNILNVGEYFRSLAIGMSQTDK